MHDYFNISNRIFIFKPRWRSLLAYFEGYISRSYKPHSKRLYLLSLHVHALREYAQKYELLAVSSKLIPSKICIHSSNHYVYLYPIYQKEVHELLTHQFFWADYSTFFRHLLVSS